MADAEQRAVTKAQELHKLVAAVRAWTRMEKPPRWGHVPESWYPLRNTVYAERDWHILREAVEPLRGMPVRQLPPELRNEIFRERAIVAQQMAMTNA